MRTAVVLPAPLGPRQAEDGAFFYIEVEPIEGTDFGLAGLVNLQQAFCVDRIQTEPLRIKNVPLSLAYERRCPLLTFAEK